METQERDRSEAANDITRVEIISEKGREYVNLDCHGIELLTQDDGRTLKIFLRNRVADSSM